MNVTHSDAENKTKKAGRAAAAKSKKTPAHLKAHLTKRLADKPDADEAPIAPNTIAGEQTPMLRGVAMIPQRPAGKITGIMPFNPLRIRR